MHLRYVIILWGILAAVFLAAYLSRREYAWDDTPTPARVEIAESVGKRLEFRQGPWIIVLDSGDTVFLSKEPVVYVLRSLREFEARIEAIEKGK